MNAKQIKNTIEQCSGLFGFEYQGKEGNVDPYYIPKKKSFEYLLFFDGTEQMVYNIDAVMTTPFIMGHSLNEVANELDITVRNLLSETKCLVCKNFKINSGLGEYKCKAYPDGIPNDIFEDNSNNKNCKSNICSFEYRRERPNDILD